MSNPPAPIKEWTASASQISDWLACHRLWYFKKVLGLFTETKASAELGTRCHTALEIYLKTGRKEGADDVLLILSTVWNQPWMLALVCNPVAEVEHVDEDEDAPIVTIGGVACKGRIDLRVRQWSEELFNTFEFTPEENVTWTPGTRLILDHKSTSNFKYMKKPEQALWDPQTVVYAQATFQDQACTQVVVVYHYFLTRDGPKMPRRVVVTHTRESLAPHLKKFEEFLAEMKATRDIPLELVARNTDACWNFGGCPFRGQCFEESKVEVEVSEEKIMADLDMDFDALLGDHSKKHAKPQENTAPPAPKFVAPSAPAQVAAQVTAQVEAMSPGPVVSGPKVTFSEGQKPLVLFGCIIPGAKVVELEELAQPYIDKWSAANKGCHYLNSDFFKAERAIAVSVITDLARGTLALPPILYVRTDSVIGKYFRNEMRYIAHMVHQVIPAGH